MASLPLWIAQPTKIFISSIPNWETGDIEAYVDKLEKCSAELIKALENFSELSHSEEKTAKVANQYIQQCIGIDELIGGFLTVTDRHVQKMIDNTDTGLIKANAFPRFQMHLQTNRPSNQAADLQKAFKQGYRWDPEQNQAEHRLRRKLDQLGRFLLLHPLQLIPEEFQNYPNEKRIADILNNIKAVLKQHLKNIDALRIHLYLCIDASSLPSDKSIHASSRGKAPTCNML